MTIRKLLIMYIVLTISLTPMLSNSSYLSANASGSSEAKFDTPDSHFIKEVPYVSQETNFYCGYATPTMIFKYYGINTTLNEVIYNSGVGYSLMYPSLENNSLPFGGWTTSQEPVICEFLSDLYGLSFTYWQNPVDLTDEKIWEEYWLLIKQNISKDIPIAVVVDELILATDNLGFVVLHSVLKSFPLVAEHFILLLGYNEDNQTVCYSDPFYGVFNKSQYGTYRWINLTKFKVSSIRVMEKLFVKAFKNTSKIPISKEEAFIKSHKRNIEKLKGNFSTYFDQNSSPVIDNDGSYSFGINASKRLKKDFEKGFNYRIKTIYKYKLNTRFGIMYRLMNWLYSHHSELFQINLDAVIIESNDVYENIAIEKKYTAEYLREIQNLLTDNNLTELCKYESVLFEYEAENWTQIADYYSEFRKKGIFMSLPRALLLMNKMADVMDNIIEIEKAIIAGPSEK